LAAQIVSAERPASLIRQRELRQIREARQHGRSPRDQHGRDGDRQRERREQEPGGRELQPSWCRGRYGSLSHKSPLVRGKTTEMPQSQTPAGQTLFAIVALLGSPR